MSGPMLYTFPRLDVTCSVSSVLGSLVQPWPELGLLEGESCLIGLQQNDLAARVFICTALHHPPRPPRVLSALLRDPWLGGDVGNQNPVHPATNRRAFKWMQLDVSRLITRASATALRALPASMSCPAVAGCQVRAGRQVEWQKCGPKRIVSPRRLGQIHKVAQSAIGGTAVQVQYKQGGKWRYRSHGRGGRSW